MLAADLPVDKQAGRLLEISFIVIPPDDLVPGPSA
jgi:hypothetical protein